MNPFSLKLATFTPIEELEKARNIAAQWASSGLSYIAVHQSNSIMWSPDKRACLGYRIIGNVALALGPPAGPDRATFQLMKDFTREIRAKGLQPAFCGVSSAHARSLRNLGYRINFVGDESTLDPTSLSLDGRSWKEVRGALNRARRRGVRFQWIDFPFRTPHVLKQVKAVSAAWLNQKQLPELGFAVGCIDSIADHRVKLGVATDSCGDIQGFVTWVPEPSQGGWMLQLLRTNPPAMPGTADFLVAMSLLNFRDAGIRHVSLSGTPLANPSGHQEFPQLLKWLLRAGSYLYDYDGLRHFKSKFNPKWKPLYVASTARFGFAYALLAAVRASAGPVGVWQLPFLAWNAKRRTKVFG